MVIKQSAKSHKDCIVKERTRQGSISSSNGYVLIFVLWAVAILSMVALGFSKDTRVSVLLKSAGAERIKDLYAARGASLYALFKLTGEDNESTVKPVSGQQAPEAAGLVEPGDPPTEGAAPVSGDNEAGEPGATDEERKIKWVPGRNPYSVQIGDISCDVYLFPENAKININGIDDKNNEIFINFLTKKGVDAFDADIITDSILDWTDDNDLTHLNGAEDGYYELLPEPYKSRDSQFLSIEELTLVRGITPEIFENIKGDITVYGDGKININVNTASPEIPSSIPGLPDDVVDELLLYIQENGSIKTSEELRQVFWDLGLVGSRFERIKPYLTIDQSDFITISAVSKGLSETPEHSVKPNLSSVQNRFKGYDYRLIVGKGDEGYEIYAVYPE